MRLLAPTYHSPRQYSYSSVIHTCACALWSAPRPRTARRARSRATPARRCVLLSLSCPVSTPAAVTTGGRVCWGGQTRLREACRVPRGPCARRRRCRVPTATGRGRHGRTGLPGGGAFPSALTRRVVVISLPPRAIINNFGEIRTSLTSRTCGTSAPQTRVCREASRVETHATTDPTPERTAPHATSRTRQTHTDPLAAAHTNTSSRTLREGALCACGRAPLRASAYGVARRSRQKERRVPHPPLACSARTLASHVTSAQRARSRAPWQRPSSRQNRGPRQ